MSAPHAALTFVRWIDSWAGIDSMPHEGPLRIDWLRAMPFILVHASCLLAFWVGWSPTALWMALGLYLFRMFAITGFYHRYFSHRSFKTSRAFQFVMAVLGATTVQRGPIWWASHHRHHHRVSDQPDDPHSPTQHGFLWSHMGWFLSRTSFAPRFHLVKDLERYPELRFLDRFDTLIPVLGGATVYAVGAVLERFAPGLHTSGGQLLVWSIISTIVVSHASFTINSLAHLFGRRRYATGDTSRNSLLLALLTFGEGWHNNHHHYPAATRQSHRWWEIDVTWYLLTALSWVRLIWDLKPVPDYVLASAMPSAEAA
jgi:stearoyl-CoA desaturase (delta-9 desaturase)